MKKFVVITLLFLFGCSTASHEHDSICKASCTNCESVELTCDIKNSKQKMDLKTPITIHPD